MRSGLQWIQAQCVQDSMETIYAQCFHFRLATVQACIQDSGRRSGAMETIQDSGFRFRLAMEIDSVVQAFRFAFRRNGNRFRRNGSGLQRKQVQGFRIPFR